MQDVATLLSDILSYMSAGWRSGSRSMRWLVRGIIVALGATLIWVLWQM